MERYSVIATDFPGQEGVFVMKPEKYGVLVAARPDMAFVGFGDFYSNVTQDGLGEGIYRSLTNFVPSPHVVLTNTQNFKSLRNGDMDARAFVIQGRNGVRLNIPAVDSLECRRCKRRGYENAAMMGIRGLFAPGNEGSIQRQFREVRDTLFTLWDQMIDLGLGPVLFKENIK